MKLDYLNGTNYTLYQPEDMYHFNADTELLGRFMDVHRKDSVLDVGCNNGALLYYAKQKNALKLTGIDLFENVIENAKENFVRNAVVADLYVCPLQEFMHAPFDLIVCNPPYFNTKNDALKNENARIKAARHEEYLCLDDLMKHVKRLLKDNGRFDMVYRPDRMKDVIAIGMQYGLYPKRLKIAYASKNKPAKSILLEFVKNKNILLDIEAPAFLNDRDSFGWKGVQK